MDLTVGTDSFPQMPDCKCNPVTFGVPVLASVEGKVPPPSGVFQLQPNATIHVFATNGSESWGLPLSAPDTFVITLVEEGWQMIANQIFGSDSCQEVESMVTFSSSQEAVAAFLSGDGTLTALSPGTANIAGVVSETTFLACPDGHVATAVGSTIVGATVTVACSSDAPVWNPDTRTCEACPPGAAWNPDAQPPARAVPLERPSTLRTSFAFAQTVLRGIR